MPPERTPRRRSTSRSARRQGSRSRSSRSRLSRSRTRRRSTHFISSSLRIKELRLGFRERASIARRSRRWRRRPCCWKTTRRIYKVDSAVSSLRKNRSYIVKHEKITQELAVSKSEIERLGIFVHVGHATFDRMIKASGTRIVEGTYEPGVFLSFPEGKDGRKLGSEEREATATLVNQLKAELAEKETELAAARDSASTGGRADKNLLFNLRTELASVRSALAESPTKLTKHNNLVFRLQLSPSDIDQILANASAPPGLAAKERAAELRRREDAKGTLSPPSSPELQIKSLKDNGAVAESEANSETGRGSSFVAKQLAKTVSDLNNTVTELRKENTSLLLMLGGVE